MIDRDIVIKELENYEPYARAFSNITVTGSVILDAIAMLKEQEPRVMTLEEVKGMKRLTICAVEQRSKVIKNTFNAEYGGIVTINGINFIDFGLYADTNRYRRTEAGYGKTWRCWTAKPTDEQREAMKWDD